MTRAPIKTAAVIVAAGRGVAPGQDDPDLLLSAHYYVARSWLALEDPARALREAERDAELSKLYGDRGEIAFGSQIRSYVLQPYQLVKDLRTDLEVGNVQGVLDGDIERFKILK